MELLREEARNRPRGSHLWIRVSRHGRVVTYHGGARCSPSPHLRGQLRPDPQGVVLDAAIREPIIDLLYSVTLSFATCFMSPFVGIALLRSPH